MSEEAALAHAELLGERANGETFQPLSGGDIDGAGKDCFASAQALGLVAEHGSIDTLIDSLFDKRLAGTRAKGTRHENTVTQDTNKHERSFTVICSPA